MNKKETTNPKELKNQNYEAKKMNTSSNLKKKKDRALPWWVELLLVQIGLPDKLLIKILNAKKTSKEFIKNEKTMILMKEHFYQAIYETEHLKEMEKRGGDRFWIDRFFARHLVLVYYWIMVFYYFFSPANAYDVNIKIEEHAFETYSKYLKDNPNDQKIKEIAQDELNHVQELNEALSMLTTV